MPRYPPSLYLAPGSSIAVFLLANSLTFMRRTQKSCFSCLQPFSVTVETAFAILAAEVLTSATQVDPIPSVSPRHLRTRVADAGVPKTRSKGCRSFRSSEFRSAAQTCLGRLRSRSARYPAEGQNSSTKHPAPSGLRECPTTNSP